MTKHEAAELEKAHTSDEDAYHGPDSIHTPVHIHLLLEQYPCS